MEFLLPVITSSTRSPDHHFPHAVINLLPRHNIDTCIIFLRIHCRFCCTSSLSHEFTNLSDRSTESAGKNCTHPWPAKSDCFSVNVISQGTHRYFLEYPFREATAYPRSPPRKNRECQTKHIRRFRNVAITVTFKGTSIQGKRVTIIIFPKTHLFNNRRKQAFSNFRIIAVTMKNRTRKCCSNQNFQTHLPIFVRQGVNLKPISQRNRIGNLCREGEHHKDLTRLPFARQVKIVHSLLYPNCEFGNLICKISQIPLSVVAKCDIFIGFPKIMLRLLQAVA